ncbi:hypothetical protein [Staphylococcus sp. IVB6227]|uniref:hypothetical protein n=1 Tax=Staphylococcus sp. IVB6227 TaxID=2989768 RepID=UPI0021D1ED44|nr:hypothetical protein [Staphylococcus sp. IVB6227]UXR78071.1 hypothetical protein MUA92_09600 [Staphylococcus sp. IVB6227]
MVERQFKMLKNIKDYSWMERYRLPYSSHQEYYNHPAIQQIHAITPLYGEWKSLSNHVGQSIGYTKKFKIKDYDHSKDYFLDTRLLSQETQLCVNGPPLNNTSLSREMYNITHVVHAGLNTITVHVQSHFMLEQLLQELEKLWVIERANDRIVSFDVTVENVCEAKCLHIKLKITNIEGAPIPTYILVNSKGETMISGDIRLDGINDIIWMYGEDELQGERYQLFIDTEDETLVHTIEISD